MVDQSFQNSLKPNMV
jgi:hypothetical protein